MFIEHQNFGEQLLQMTKLTTKKDVGFSTLKKQPKYRCLFFFVVVVENMCCKKHSFKISYI